MIIDGKKTCARCRETKPVSEFSRKKGRDGYAYQCKPCRKIIKAAAYKNHVPREPVARKKCFRCGKTKPASAFYRCTTATTGLSAQCRTCNAKRLKEKYPERGPIIRAGMRRIRERDPKKWYAKLKEWRAANWDWVLEYGRAQHKKTYPRRAPILRTRAVAYRNAHAAEIKAKQKTERWRQISRMYVARRRARERNLAATFTKEQWRVIVAEFEGLCAYCQKQPGPQMEHIVAVTRGGGFVAGNIIPACETCNKTKAARTIEDFCAERGYDAAAIQARAAAPFVQPEAVAA